MKIEFGGGNNPRQPTYVQVDIRKLNESTLDCNSWEIQQHVAPNSVTDIYSRHFFEHLTYAQAQRTLRAWHNICTPGAKIILICPNMTFHIDQWNNWDNLSDPEKKHCRAGFWGWQRQGDKYSWDLHKCGYDFPKLKELLLEHHFKDIKLTSPPSSRHLSVEFYK